MPDNNNIHPPNSRASAPRLFGPCALALAFVACAATVNAQSRKPTVEDPSETKPAAAPRTEQDAGEPGRSTEAPRGVRARRVNTSAPASPSSNAPAPSAPAESSVATTPAPNTAATKETAADEGATRVGRSVAATANDSAASVEDSPNVAATKDAPAATGGDAAPSAAPPRAGGVEGELEELRARALAAKSDAERARAQRALADRLVELNRTEDAVTVLRMLMREDRFDPVGLYNIGNALARLDDAQAAAEAYRKAVAQKRGNYSRALNNLGVVLIRLGHWDEAAAALASALRLENGNYAEASFNTGRLHALRGDPEAAANEYLRALASDPEHVESAVALARAYAEGGEPERALKFLDQFAARFVHRGSTTPRAIDVARGEIVAARNVSAETRGGRLSGDERAAGTSGVGAGRPPAANASEASANDTNVAARPSAVALLPGASRLSTPAKSGALTLGQQTFDLLQRARAARGAGRHDEAVGLYRRMLAQQGGYFAPANLELGYALTGLQRPDEAIAALSLVAARDGARYPVVFYHLGRLYERTNRLPLAAEAFARAAQLYGDQNPQMLLDVSRVREKEGNTAAALAAMEDYVRALERTSSVPEWAAARLAQLRRNATARKP